MYDLSREIGVKSYSFRNITDNAEVAKVARRCGVATVDLSGCHVNYDEPDRWAGVIAGYRDAGVRLTGIGVVQAKPEEAWNRRFFEFAKLAEAGLISFSFPPDGHEVTLGLMAKLSDEYGMTLAIHNHGGYDWLGSSTMLNYMFKRCPKSIGLCLDTAWCLQTGEDPVKWLDLFGERLYGIHFKDFRFKPEGGRPLDTVVGKGALKLAEFLAKLKGLDFKGSAVVEYEGENPEENSAASIAGIRAALNDLA